MYVLQNRGVALLLCLAMIFAASLFGTATSLGALRDRSESVFFSSGMQQDLIDLSAQCANIATIASFYMPADLPDIVRVNELREALSAAGTPREKHAAVEELMTATGYLLGRLKDGEASPSDNDRAQGAWASAQSKQSLLGGSAYNEAVTSYNALLGKFPVSFLSKLTGQRPLELYA